MKVGDKINVTIGTENVAEAVIKDMTDGVATLEFPATRVRMGIRSELTDLPVEEPTKQVIVDEVVKPETVAPVEAVVKPEETTLAQQMQQQHK